MTCRICASRFPSRPRKSGASRPGPPTLSAIGEEKWQKQRVAIAFPPTCAPPIIEVLPNGWKRSRPRRPTRRRWRRRSAISTKRRSEERRVGKEGISTWRYRWKMYTKKQKKKQKKNREQ